MLTHSLASILFVFCLVLQYAIGTKALSLSKLHKQPSTLRSITALPIGIVLHVSVLHFLSNIGIPLWLSGILPFLFLLYRPQDSITALREVLQNWRSVIRIDFFIFVAVIISIAVSLFKFDNAHLVTGWVNNYGDLPFHIGMITSFAFGANIPQELQIMAGEPLSYPMYINLWTAFFQDFFSEIKVSFLIIKLQWITLWTLIYLLCTHFSHRVLPWLILFGGGSFLTLAQHSGELIHQGWPWSVFLTTVWITQRSSLLGLMALLTVLAFYKKSLEAEQEKKKKQYLVTTGLLLSLMPLIHTHLFIVTCAYIFFHILLEKRFGVLKIFILSLAPAFLFAPWLLEKESLIGLIDASHPWGANTTLMNWAASAAPWVLLVISLALWSKKYSHLLSITLCFYLCSRIKLSIWEWDQLKCFITLYVISLFFLDLRSKRWLLLVPLVLPALFELYTVNQSWTRNTVYSKQDFAIAQSIRDITKPSDSITSKPDHNSPVTLSGRKMFMGYVGTLHSHGLNYHSRKRALENIYSGDMPCHRELGPDNPDFDHACPDYLLWTDREQREWPQFDPAKVSYLENTSQNELFLFKPQKHKDLKTSALK